MAHDPTTERILTKLSAKIFADSFVNMKGQLMWLSAMKKQRELDPISMELIDLAMNDEIAFKAKSIEILWDAIRLYETQTELAKQLHCVRQTLTYRINHAQKIPLEYMLKLIQHLRSQKTGTHVVSHLLTMLTLADRIKLASDDLKRGKKAYLQKTVPIDLKKDGICQNNREDFDKSNTKSERFDQMIAEKYDLGNRGTLRHGMKTLQKGCPAVIQAMNDKRITIHKAWRLSCHPRAVQPTLLEEALREQNQHTSARDGAPSKSIRLADAVDAIQNDSFIQGIEAKTQEPIIPYIKTLLYGVAY